ncbi:hypothetical protein PSAC2689_60379 [Paraburkholderia sacchari]
MNRYGEHADVTNDSKQDCFIRRQIMAYFSFAIAPDGLRLSREYEFRAFPDLLAVQCFDILAHHDTKNAHSHATSCWSGIDFLLPFLSGLRQR